MQTRPTQGPIRYLLIALLVTINLACSSQPTRAPLNVQGFQPIPEATLHLPNPEVPPPADGSPEALMLFSMDLMEHIQIIRNAFDQLVTAVRDRQGPRPAADTEID